MITRSRRFLSSKCFSNSPSPKLMWLRRVVVFRGFCSWIRSRLCVMSSCLWWETPHWCTTLSLFSINVAHVLNWSWLVANQKRCFARYLYCVSCFIKHWRLVMERCLAWKHSTLCSGSSLVLSSKLSVSLFNHTFDSDYNVILDGNRVCEQHPIIPATVVITDIFFNTSMTDVSADFILTCLNYMFGTGKENHVFVIQWMPKDDGKCFKTF